MDELEKRLRERLRAASAEIQRATPPARPRAAIRRGLFLHRLHVASLGGVAAAAVVLVALIATQTPSGSALRPVAGEDLLDLLPLPSGSPKPSPYPTIRPSPSSTPTAKPSPSPRPTTSEYPKPSPSPITLDGCAPYAPVRPPDGMQVSLRTLKKAYARGEPVTMSLAVQNMGVTPVANSHSSGQKYDFFIMQGRTVVWKWSDGKVFTQAIEQETFAPGQKREATEAWDQTRCGGLDSALQPGKYLAYGLWTTMTDEGTRGWWSNPVDFEIL